MPPFLPKTFTFLKFDTFTGLTKSQFHISPKTFTFFKSNLMTIFKGFTPTLLVFLKSFLGDFLFPEFIFAGFTQFCWPPGFQRPKTEKLQALVICTRQDVLKRKLSRKIKYLVDMHFQKRKRQSLGNKTFLQKKDMFLDDNDKDLSQLSLFFLQNITNATSRSKWKLSYWLQALFGIFLLRLSTRPRPRWTIRKNGSRRKRGERRGKSNTIMKYCFLFLIYRERSHQFVQYLEVVRKKLTI